MLGLLEYPIFDTRPKLTPLQQSERTVYEKNCKRSSAVREFPTPGQAASKTPLTFWYHFPTATSDFSGMSI